MRQMLSPTVNAGGVWETTNDADVTPGPQQFRYRWVDAYLQRPYTMPGLRFVWDVDKESVNRRKHGVTFTEARSAFDDENGLLIDDPDHSRAMEERFVLMGLSESLRVLVVVHSYLEGGEVIRIISARKATPSERARYSWGS